MSTTTSSVERAVLPLKATVGMMLINRHGHVWLGRKRPKWSAADAWHMPQGGLLKQEEQLSAVLRELEEETGVTSIEVLGVSSTWRTWELPDELIGVALKRRFRGQRQLWFAARFTGENDEIDISGRGGAIKSEFSAWRWASARDAIMDTVPFKQQVYRDVFDEFAPYLQSAAPSRPKIDLYSTAVTA
jgi:putative (di)nucleoside polyphosphate hydrolase